MAETAMAPTTLAGSNVDKDPDEYDVMDPRFIHTFESLGKSFELKEGEHKSAELKLVPLSD
jgi:hypothetical protein